MNQFRRSWRLLAPCGSFTLALVPFLSFCRQQGDCNCQPRETLGDAPSAVSRSIHSRNLQRRHWRSAVGGEVKKDVLEQNSNRVGSGSFPMSGTVVLWPSSNGEKRSRLERNADELGILWKSRFCQSPYLKRFVCNFVQVIIIRHYLTGEIIVCHVRLTAGNANLAKLTTLHVRNFCCLTNVIWLFPNVLYWNGFYNNVWLQKILTCSTLLQ